MFSAKPPCVCLNLHFFLRFCVSAQFLFWFFSLFSKAAHHPKVLCFVVMLLICVELVQFLLQVFLLLSPFRSSSFHARTRV